MASPTLATKCTLTKEASEQIKAISFVCALLVVTIHCPILDKREWIANPSYRETISYLNSCGYMVLDVLQRAAVPSFMAISGFFLAYKYEPGLKWFVHLVCRRFWTLYVPFVAWNALYWLLMGFRDGFSIESLPNAVLGLDFYMPVAGFHLWFIRTLLFLILIFPMVIFVMKSAGIFVVLTLFMLALFKVDFASPFCGTSLAFFFSLGVYLGMDNRWRMMAEFLKLHRDAVKFSALTFALCLITLSFLVGLSVMRYERYLGFMFPLTLASCFVLWASKRVLASCLKCVSSLWGLSFFIYAFQIVAISGWSQLFRKMGFEAISFGGLLGVVKLCLVFITIIGTGVVVRKIFPMSYKLLTGGRA